MLTYHQWGTLALSYQMHCNKSAIPVLQFCNVTVKTQQAMNRHKKFRSHLAKIRNEHKVRCWGQDGALWQTLWTCRKYVVIMDIVSCLDGFSTKMWQMQNLDCISIFSEQSIVLCWIFMGLTQNNPNWSGHQHEVDRRPEAVRFRFRHFQSIWSLTGNSATLLLSCLSNFRAIR